jgi:hypothetical protein
MNEPDIRLIRTRMEMIRFLMRQHMQELTTKP